MRTITSAQIDDLISQAAASDRKRTIFRLHEHHEPVQRMVNALVPGTYVTPHQHGDPPKVELLSILRGRVAVFHFEPDGQIRESHMLEAGGPVEVIDIAPGDIHSMIALEPAAVLEIVQGPYDPATHKQFAEFAPPEGDPAAVDYLAWLDAQT
jgi:cupin fold WbuC family metalloprotein